MGKDVQSSYSDVQLLEEAKKMYNVFHLHVLEGSAGHRSLNYWKEILGQNCIEIEHHEDISNKISEIVLSHTIFDGGKKIILNEKDKPSTEEEVLL